MINNVTLTGRLTRAVELKYSGQGRAYGRTTIAVNRTFTSQNGEREADFINLVVFGKTAETMSQYLTKGSLIGIVGRIQTGSYDNDQGQKVYTTDVVVDQFTFLESRNQNSQDGNFNQQQNNQNFNSNSNQNSNNQQSTNDFIDDLINDDDLPF